MTTCVTLTLRKYQQQQLAQQRQQQQQHLRQLTIVRFHYKRFKCGIIRGRALPLNSHVNLKRKPSRHNMRTISNEM